MLQFYPVVLVLVSNLVDPSLAQYKSPISARIWNGFESAHGQFPYNVAIINRKRVDVQDYIAARCGGSIISERYILTAASCIYEDWDMQVQVDEMILSPYDAIVGLIEFTSGLKWDPVVRDKQVMPIEEIILHPDFVGDEDGRKHDLAVCRLLHNLTMEENVVEKINLPIHSAGILQPKAKRDYYIAGYGMKGQDLQRSTKLRSTVMKLKSDQWCKEAFTMFFFGPADRTVSLFVSELHICAEGDVTHVCEGDYGAGLVGYPDKNVDFELAKPTDGFIMGILSWTPSFRGCGLAFPAVFTRLTPQHIEWIINVFKEYHELENQGF